MPYLSGSIKLCCNRNDLFLCKFQCQRLIFTLRVRQICKESFLFLPKKSLTERESPGTRKHSCLMSTNTDQQGRTGPLRDVIHLKKVDLNIKIK